MKNRRERGLLTKCPALSADSNIALPRPYATEGSVQREVTMA